MKPRVAERSLMDLRSHCQLLGKPWEPKVRDKENFLGMVFYRKCRTLLLRQVQFSHSVMSDSATPWTTALQYSLSMTNTWSLLRLMSIESVIPSNHLIFCSPLLLLPSIFPSTGSFPVSQLFTSGGQSIGVSASASVLQWIFRTDFLYNLSGWISLQSEGLARVFSNTTVQKHQFFSVHLFFMVQLAHSCITTGKTTALTKQILVGRVMSLLFNMLSRLVITFLPRSQCLLTSWLQSPSAVILEPKVMKYVTVSIVSPSICHEEMGPEAMILVFWMLSLTHWKRSWCWERLKAGGEGNDRGWDGWMAPPTQWTWVWARSRSQWWTGKPGVLPSMQ